MRLINYTIINGFVNTFLMKILLTHFNFRLISVCMMKAENKNGGIIMKAGKEKKKGFIRRHKVLTVIIAVVLAAAIAVTGLVLGTKKSSGTAYSFIRTTTLVRGTLEDTVSATGTVRPAAAARL